MTASSSVDATISVSSGCLCFGSLQNIWDGASMPVQSFPTARPRASGTVKTQPIEFNIAALNGTWNAFELIDLSTNGVCAWFLAHSEVDPEIDRILRVSGSPYEPGSGSIFNDHKTAAKGVFVINHYDWGGFSKKQSTEETVQVQEPDPGQFAAAGIVDLKAAKPLGSEGGAWLHIPDGEYTFGRVSFDDDRVAARSFLLFTTNTYFTRTVFKGLENTLRKEETPEERFQRGLQKGSDFSGLEALREIASMPEFDVRLWHPPPPPQADCLGPYDPSDHVLRAQDTNAIRLHRNADELKLIPRNRHDMTSWRMDAPIREFVESWAEPLYDLVNEMVLSYLQRTVIPHMGNRGVFAAAELLFPHHTQEGEEWQLDVWCYRHFTDPDALPIPNFDSTYVRHRIASFLSRFGDASVVFADECVAGITRAVAYMLTEVLEMANRHSHENERSKVIPSDVRMVVYLHVAQLRDRFRFSRVSWEGRDGQLPLESKEQEEERHEGVAQR